MPLQARGGSQRSGDVKMRHTNKLLVFFIVALFAVSMSFAAFGPADATASGSSSSSSTSSGGTTGSSSSGGGSLPPSTSEVVEAPAEETAPEVAEDLAAPALPAEEPAAPSSENLAGMGFFAGLGEVVTDLSGVWIGLVIIAGLVLVALGIFRHVRNNRNNRR